MIEASDNMLVARYRSGDAAGFDSLYDRYRIPVYSYISRQVNQTAVAEDIFQDVWLRVVRSIDQYRTDQHFPAWLFKIARNRLVDYWRQQTPDFVETSDEIAADNPAPEHLQFIRSCIERLMALLQTLKPEQRDAFVLQQESGLTLAQIAQIADCGRETIKSRLRYAINSLRQGLEGCDE